MFGDSRLSACCSLSLFIISLGFKNGLSPLKPVVPKTNILITKNSFVLVASGIDAVLKKKKQKTASMWCQEAYKAVFRASLRNKNVHF